MVNPVVMKKYDPLDTQMKLDLNENAGDKNHLPNSAGYEMFKKLEEAEREIKKAEIREKFKKLKISKMSIATAFLGGLKKFTKEMFDENSKKGFKKLKKLYKKGDLKKSSNISDVINGRESVTKALEVFSNMHFKSRQKSIKSSAMNSEFNSPKISDNRVGGVGNSKFKSMTKKLTLNKKGKGEEKSVLKEGTHQLRRNKTLKEKQEEYRVRTMKNISRKSFNLEGEFEKPNKEKLKDFLKTCYIHDENEQPYKFCKSLKESNTQNTLSCYKQKKTVFGSLGPGVELYFNFLKITIIFMFLCFLTTLPIQITNSRLYIASKNPSLKPPGEGMTSVLFKMMTATSLAVKIKI